MLVLTVAATPRTPPLSFLIGSCILLARINYMMDHHVPGKLQVQTTEFQQGLMLLILVHMHILSSLTL